MKKVLLIDTSVATANLGDEIINRSIEKNWQELIEDNYIVHFPSHTPPYTWWQQLFISKKKKQLMSFDYKFLCGTNALYTNMLRPLPQWNIYPHNCKMLKDTILLGVGAGNNSSSINFYTRYLYNKVLSHDYFHSVRDEYTKKMLEKLGFRAINTGCPTLWGLTPSFCKKIPRVKSESVIFTLTSYSPDRKMDTEFVKILYRNYEKRYFWPQTITDKEYLDSLGFSDYQLVAPNLSAYDKVLLNNVDYIGNRLHGGIRALQFAKRTLIVSIDYRADNMGNNYTIPIIQRSNILNELQDKIDEEYEIHIGGIDWQGIEDWKKQFVF